MLCAVVENAINICKENNTNQKLFNMERIIKKNGFVYLVQDWDRKGFETFYNLGKDPDDPRWKEEEEKPKQKKTKVKKDE